MALEKIVNLLPDFLVHQKSQSLISDDILSGIGGHRSDQQQEEGKGSSSEKGNNYLQINNILESILNDNAIHNTVIDTNGKKNERNACIYGRMSDSD